MMKSSELVAKALDIARNYRTLYVMGCFGAPMTASNKKRYTQNHSYNRKAARTAKIQAASEDTFGFDCVNLIKGILWGWRGDKTKTYGGAGYAVNGVPDIGADRMIAVCPDASTTGWETMEPGEAVWLKGHIGIYVGNGLAVECTPSWANKVQITAVGNIGSKAGYKTRKWTKHGHLPYVEYTGTVIPPQKPSTNPAKVTAVKASGYASSLDKSLSGTYQATAALNVRDKPGTKSGGKEVKILVTIPKGTKVRNYGYYTLIDGVKWLYVQFTYKGVTYTGFCSGDYLRR